MGGLGAERGGVKGKGQRTGISATVTRCQRPALVSQAPDRPRRDRRRKKNNRRKELLTQQRNERLTIHDGQEWFRATNSYCGRGTTRIPERGRKLWSSERPTRHQEDQAKI